MRFNYEGFNSLGCVKRGWIDANSVEDAGKRLREMEIFAQSIAPEGVPLKSVLPDEKASEVNFPKEAPKYEPGPPDRIKVYDPSRAGQPDQPDVSGGSAKAYDPFKTRLADADPQPGPKQDTPLEPAILETDGKSQWHEDLARDLESAKEIGEAVRQIATRQNKETDIVWSDPARLGEWAVKILVERAAINAFKAKE